LVANGDGNKGQAAIARVVARRAGLARGIAAPHWLCRCHATVPAKTCRHKKSRPQRKVESDR
jgi:hypothetical protein